MPQKGGSNHAATIPAVRREWWAGGAMIALGLGTAIHAASYNVGSLARMGVA